MTLEEKIRDILYMFDQNHNFTFTDTSKVIVSICQQEIDEACKEQREIINHEVKEALWMPHNSSVENLILNAPSPKEKL